MEIGCGATIHQLLRNLRAVELTWVVLSAQGDRAKEARASAKTLLRAASRLDVRLGTFRDGFLPAQFAQAKEYFEQIKSTTTPDLIFTHSREDRHQDHRLASELTWNTWRDHLLLEYEIPKYEGDLGQPNLFVPITRASLDRKLSTLMRHFGSQRSKTWFSADTFLGLMRLRGIECRSPTGYAEAFHAKKVTLDIPSTPPER